MSHNTTKITVFNDLIEEDEDVKLYYSTVTDTVGIACGEEKVHLTKDQFKALAYLMRKCFYTRDMLDEMQMVSDSKSPYNVFSSFDGKTWALDEEKDRGHGV